MAGKEQTKAEAAADDSEFVQRITEAYTAEGRSLHLGSAVKGDAVLADARVAVPLAMMNRHGLIAGATGTGKTVTLQLLAEQLADAGVAVFAADMKGDLSGLMREGEHNEKIDERVAALKIDWKPQARTPVFWSLGGLGEGIPLRATVRVSDLSSSRRCSGRTTRSDRHSRSSLPTPTASSSRSST